MHSFYINLDRRTDRREQVEAEFSKMGIEVERFSAFEMSPGGIGCSKSHLEVLKLARERNYPSVMVFEDDFQLNPDVSPEEFRTTIATLPEDYDVVLIAYNMVRCLPGETFGRVIESQSTPGYIVHQKYYDTLIRRWEEGLALYMQNPYQHWLYILDQYWKPLQLTDTWYYTMTPLGYQRPGHSDLSNTFIDYNRQRTFVSAFFIPADRPPLLHKEGYKAQFDILVKTGISIILYLDDTLDWTFPDNVKVVRLPFSDTWISQAVPDNVIITNDRKFEKDTIGYMKIQHSKMEWIHRASQWNPYGTDWFAWVDFGLGRLLDIDTRERLPRMHVPSEPRMVTPGCWAWVGDNVWGPVQWRFCGGFFMIHKDIIHPFWKAYKAAVLAELPKFTWEVNIWALMEWNRQWEFGWVRGAHDTTIIPRDYSPCPWACVRGYMESLEQAGVTLYPEAKKDLDEHKKRLQTGTK